MKCPKKILPSLFTKTDLIFTSISLSRAFASFEYLRTINDIFQGFRTSHKNFMLLRYSLDFYVGSLKGNKRSQFFVRYILITHSRMNRRYNYRAFATSLRPKRVRSIASLITPFAERVFNDEVNYTSSRVGARRLTARFMQKF